MHINFKHIGRRVREIRNEKGMSQAIWIECMACECSRSKYKLSPLSGGKEIILDGLVLPERNKQERFLLEIYCKVEKRIFAFELTMALIDGRKKEEL